MAAKLASAQKIYCSNPYGNKHAEIAKNKTFLRVTSQLVESTLGLIPELREGDYLCKTCNLRIYNFVRSQAGPRPIKSDTPKCSSSDSEAPEEDDEVFCDASTCKEDLSRLFQSMQISCEEIEKDYVSTKSAATVYQRFKGKIEDVKQNLQRLTATNNDLSPKKAMAATSKQLDCIRCKKLLQELATRFQYIKKKEEKYKILTCTPPGTSIQTMTEAFGCSISMARTASRLRNTVGAFSHPIYKGRQGLDDKIVRKVREFYASDENSRVDPCLRRAVYVVNPDTGTRELQAKRVLWMTLREFHQEFLSQNPGIKISVTSISELRPKNIIWSGKNGFHNSCTCTIHENFRLLLEALGTTLELRGILESLFCSTNNDLCMFGVCDKCPNSSIMEGYFSELGDGPIPYSYWGTSPGTVGLQLLDSRLELNDFVAKFTNSVPALASHHFTALKQADFIRNLKENVIRHENAAVLQVDYAQNYSFVTQNAVAGHHWSNNQATVHPFVLTWYCKTECKIKKKAFVVISNELKHDASTFHGFKVTVLRQMAKENLVFDKIYFVSDGCSGQYKCVKQFILLMYMERDFGVKSEWHFYATSHGKSECDAVAATVKRSCRLASLKLDPVSKKQINIRNIDEMFSYAKQKLESETLEILKVPVEALPEVLVEFDVENRYLLGDTIPGTRMYHSFVPLDSTRIAVRRYSASPQVRELQFLGNSEVNPGTYSVGEHVAVQILNSFAVGRVFAESHENGEYDIELMQKVGKGNCFRWPDVVNIQTFAVDEILLPLMPPSPKSTDTDTWSIHSSEFKAVKALAVK